MKLSVFGMALVLVAGPAVAVADDMDDAYQSLKDAVAKKDAAAVKKVAPEAYQLAKKAEAEPAPASADEKEAWTQHVAYAKDVESFTEYSLYATAVQSPSEQLIELIAMLEAQNPKSKYLADAYAPYFAALNATGASAKIPAIAEKALENLPDNEDVLAVGVEQAMKRSQVDRALTLANRLTAAVNKHSKPEGVQQADWDRRRSALLAQGYYTAGVIYGSKQQFALSDKALRAALPLIKGNNAMMGPALFQLGVDNYQLGKMTNNKAKILEAAKFSEDAAAIPGAHADQAWRNAQLMKTEAGRMR
jgi:hypothetical protein